MQPFIKYRPSFQTYSFTCKLPYASVIKPSPSFALSSYHPKEGQKSIFRIFMHALDKPIQTLALPADYMRQLSNVKKLWQVNRLESQKP